MQLGKIVRSTGSWYKVLMANNVVVDARLKGKIRLIESNATNPIAVGDIVNVKKEDGDLMIIDVQKRKNYIIRQSPKRKKATHILAANIDLAFLLVTIKKPRTSTGFIDRFLITNEAYKIPTHIIFNKQDVLTEKDAETQKTLIDIYSSIGYPCHLVSSITKVGIDDIKAIMKDKTTLLCGHSGVGKSTFANAIDENLNLKTKELSTKFSKGVHTTTFAELFTLPFGGELIDIPGIKEFGVIDFEKEEVSHYFPEMAALINECKFNNCLHLDEPGCAIKEAIKNGSINIERYKNYLNILDDIEEAKDY